MNKKVVALAGIEPALQWNTILNRTRLPIPPQSHFYCFNNEFYISCVPFLCTQYFLKPYLWALVPITLWILNPPCIPFHHSGIKDAMIVSCNLNVN